MSCYVMLFDFVAIYIWKPFVQIDRFPDDYVCTDSMLTPWNSLNITIECDTIFPDLGQKYVFLDSVFLNGYHTNTEITT